jgi:hypothetical protein
MGATNAAKRGPKDFLVITQPKGDVIRLSASAGGADSGAKCASLKDQSDELVKPSRNFRWTAPADADGGNLCSHWKVLCAVGG